MRSERIEATCLSAKQASGGFTEDGRRKRNRPRPCVEEHYVMGKKKDTVRGQRSVRLERQQGLKQALVTPEICRIAPLNAQP